MNKIWTLLGVSLCVLVFATGCNDSNTNEEMKQDQMMDEKKTEMQDDKMMGQ